MTDRLAPRPPAAYIHGNYGPIAIVPGRVAAWLESRLQLDRVRREIRGADAEIDFVLIALGTVANAWRTAETGSKAAAEPEAGPTSKWVGTQQAATALSITERAVRLAIAEHRLPAEKVDGRWRITREDIAHAQAARAA